MVQKLPENLTKLITHELVKVIHPYGDITCPLTNKKVIGTKYRDHIDKETELFGKADTAFDYESAPPRGWQEGKKDFTDKPTYRRFHDYPENDPYSVF